MKKIWGFFCFFGAFCLVTATAVSAQFLLPEDFNHRLGVYQLDTALGGSRTETEGGIAILGADVYGDVFVDLRVWAKGSSEPTCKFRGSAFGFDINSANPNWTENKQEFASEEFVGETIYLQLSNVSILKEGSGNSYIDVPAIQFGEFSDCNNNGIRLQTFKFKQIRPLETVLKTFTKEMRTCGISIQSTGVGVCTENTDSDSTDTWMGSADLRPSERGKLSVVDKYYTVQVNQVAIYDPFTDTTERFDVIVGIVGIVKSGKEPWENPFQERLDQMYPGGEE